MRSLLPLLLIGCYGAKYTDTDTAGCEASWRTEDYQSTETEMACFKLDPDKMETVIRVVKCYDYECFATENITSDGFEAEETPELFCVPNDKEHKYRATIIYCTPYPSQQDSVDLRDLLDLDTAG